MARWNIWRLHENMDEHILKKLCSKAKLDRDKGFQDFEEFLKSVDDGTVLSIERKFTDMLSDSTNEWETKHGVLMGSKAIFQSGKTTEEFSNILLQNAVSLADDAEFRVRIAAGKLIYCSSYILSVKGFKD